MTNKRVSPLATTALLLIMFMAPAILACECVLSPPKRTFKRSRAVFVATLLSGDGLTTTAEMRVTEAFKGVRVGTVVRIGAFGSCGILFRAGRTYLVQIRYGCSETRPPDPGGPDFYAEMCSYTHPVDDPEFSKALHAFRRYAAWWRSPLSGRERRCD